jgi:hypothetical protein
LPLLHHPTFRHLVFMSRQSELNLLYEFAKSALVSLCHHVLASGFIAAPFPSPLRRAGLCRRPPVAGPPVIVWGARPPRAQSATPSSLTLRGIGTKPGTSLAPVRSSPRGRGKPQPGAAVLPICGGRARPSGRASACAAPRLAEPFATGQPERGLSPIRSAWPNPSA